MQTEAAPPTPNDVSLHSLPEKEELERLDALLSEMVARTQAELERLSQRTHPPGTECLPQSEA
jgi:hypothetical protein